MSDNREAVIRKSAQEILDNWKRLGYKYVAVSTDGMKPRVRPELQDRGTFGDTDTFNNYKSILDPSVLEDMVEALEYYNRDKK